MKSFPFCGFLILAVTCQAAWSTTYQLPATKGDTVIYQTQPEETFITADQDETLLDVALRHTLGQNEIVRLNPKLDRWLIKQGQTVKLPNIRILPDTPHKGITLNISEFRMYYYPPGEPGVVKSYAHGIGRQDWKTPMGQTSVTKKVKDPVWHPPESIRKEHAANGDPLPEVVPAGPNNPLGQHALYLNLPGEYRIHGTDVNKIYGIGMQITHGCIRMYPEDIEALYNSVPIGTPVYLVKQPIKVGWLENQLYVEAHPDLEGEEQSQTERYSMAWKLIQKATGEEEPEVDQKALNEVLNKLDGEPIAIYERAAPLVPPLPPEQEAPEPAAAPPTVNASAKSGSAEAASPPKKSSGGYYRGP